MRALRFTEYGPAGVLHVAEVAEPHAGPGQLRVAVRASGVTPADTYLRSGRFRDRIPLPLPHGPGVDAAGVVDEVGAGVTDVRVGDAVFGVVDVARAGGANAEFAVLVGWARKPAAWSWAQAGGVAANAETAARALDRLAVGPGATVLVEGAAGGVGTVAVPFALARGATVIGTAGPGTQDFVAGLGATPTRYGPGLRERVAALAPAGVTAVLDCAGSGSLPELVAIAGDPARVVTVADLAADRHGVHLSRTGGGPGADPQALHGLTDAVALAAAGRFTVPLAGVFPLIDAVAAHELSETGHAHGKIVLTHG
jgi:NADPH:quinone reductase-like Zn-dependent oxidoreductase